MGRGIAAGDIDNDGDTDVLVSNNSGPARLLVNQRGSAAPWLGVRLLTAAGVRDELGARVTVERAGAAALERRVQVDGSFASANDPRALIGLGEARPTAVRLGTPERRILWTEPVVGRYAIWTPSGGGR